MFRSKQVETTPFNRGSLFSSPLVRLSACSSLLLHNHYDTSGRLDDPLRQNGSITRYSWGFLLFCGCMYSESLAAVLRIELTSVSLNIALLMSHLSYGISDGAADLCKLFNPSQRHRPAIPEAPRKPDFGFSLIRRPFLSQCGVRSASWTQI